MSKSAILRRPGTRHERTFDKPRRRDVILSAAKRGPNARQEVVQMRGDQAGDLRHSGLRAVHDEGHEEQRKGQELCVEVENEKVDLARGVVLGEGVCVCEREGGEKGVAVQAEACEGLENTVLASIHLLIIQT
jgi:hypothetical protein